MTPETNNSERTPVKIPEIDQWHQIEVNLISRHQVEVVLELCRWYGYDWSAARSGSLRRIRLQFDGDIATFLLRPHEQTRSPLRINHPLHRNLWIEIDFPTQSNQIQTRFFVPEYFTPEDCSMQSLFQSDFLDQAFERLHSLAVNPQTKVQIQQRRRYATKWERIRGKKKTTIEMVLHSLRSSYPQ